MKDEGALQELLYVYHVTPNPNTPAGMIPAVLMFARKIKSDFDNLLPSKKRKIARQNTARYFIIDGKVFVMAYKNGNQGEEDGVIAKHIGKRLYLVKNRKRIQETREPSEKRIH